MRTTHANAIIRPARSGYAHAFLARNYSYPESFFDGAGSLTLLPTRESDNSAISTFTHCVDDTGNRGQTRLGGGAR